MSHKQRFDRSHDDRRFHPVATAEEIDHLRQVIGRQGAELQTVSEVIASSPALSAALLSHANGARFGWENPIGSVRHAVALLGLRRLQDFANHLEHSGRRQVTSPVRRSLLFG